MDNAINYTSAGEFALRWFAEGDADVLEVRDTGAGIPERDLPRIFERFYRVDKARSRDLGLSIDKHPAFSQFEQGSTFTVRLPRAVR